MVITRPGCACRELRCPCRLSLPWVTCLAGQPGDWLYAIGQTSDIPLWLHLATTKPLISTVTHTCASMHCASGVFLHLPAHSADAQPAADAHMGEYVAGPSRLPVVAQRCCRLHPLRCLEHPWFLSSPSFLASLNSLHGTYHTRTTLTLGWGGNDPLQNTSL